MSDNRSRWDEIRRIQIESVTAYRILGGLVLVGFLILFGQENAFDRSDFDLNLFTEIIGVAITVLIVDTIYSYRDKRRRESDTSTRLLSKARSPLPDVSKDAFHEMMELELIYGETSILKGENLFRASPGKVSLNRARMEGAFMMLSDFSGSSFSGAILDNANLVAATLENGSFRNASLRNANLEHAKLSGATFWEADLTGANLLGAEIDQDLYIHPFLKEGEREENPFLHDIEQVTLPNGCKLKTDTDLTRFTDPYHPNFWHSCDPESPAFRGKRWTPSNGF